MARVPGFYWAIIADGQGNPWVVIGYLSDVGFFEVMTQTQKVERVSKEGLLWLSRKRIKFSDYIPIKTLKKFGCGNLVAK